MQQEAQTIESIARSITTKEDFEHFLQLLIESYHQEVGEWENRDLEHYLSA